MLRSEHIERHSPPSGVVPSCALDAPINCWHTPAD